MDVHPPHGGIHSWRDFFIHLVVITLGLLIALGLEGIVEWRHNKHLVHTAEGNLRAELEANQKTLADDLAALNAAQKQIETDLTILSALRAKHVPGAEPKFHWDWNGPSSAAWDTARNTGAIALMNYQTAQNYSVIYEQQGVVNEQSGVFVRDLYRAGAPLQGGEKSSDLKPAQLDAINVNLQQTLADVNYLRDLGNSLGRLYQRAPQ